jgi:hypothetical protein
VVVKVLAIRKDHIKTIKDKEDINNKEEDIREDNMMMLMKRMNTNMIWMKMNMKMKTQLKLSEGEVNTEKMKMKVKEGTNLESTFTEKDSIQFILIILKHQVYKDQITLLRKLLKVILEDITLVKKEER